MYVANAEASGVERARLGGTLQNDILKEYQAQKEFIFPPRPSLRLVADTIRFCTAEMPRWHPLSISGYHIREAGSTAAEELAFTLTNGFAYVELGGPPGSTSTRSRRACRSSSTRTSTSSRRSRSTAPRAASGRAGSTIATARGERAVAADALPHADGGRVAHREQPEVNIVRTAIEALAGVLGGTQASTPTRWTRRCAPDRTSGTIALRTQQVIANESRVANVADPLGGSWYVEELTDELERGAEAIFARIDELGEGSMLDGAVRGVEEGWYQSAISDSAYELERKLNAGRHAIGGGTGFLEGNDEPPPDTLRIGPEVEEEQRRRLDKVRHERDSGCRGTRARRACGPMPPSPRPT